MDKDKQKNEGINYNESILRRKKSKTRRGEQSSMSFRLQPTRSRNKRSGSIKKKGSASKKRDKLKTGRTTDIMSKDKLNDSLLDLEEGLEEVQVECGRSNRSVFVENEKLKAEAMSEKEEPIDPDFDEKDMYTTKTLVHIKNNHNYRLRKGGSDIKDRSRTTLASATSLPPIPSSPLLKTPSRNTRPSFTPRMTLTSIKLGRMKRSGSVFFGSPKKTLRRNVRISGIELCENDDDNILSIPSERLGVPSVDLRRGLLAAREFSDRLARVEINKRVRSATLRRDETLKKGSVVPVEDFEEGGDEKPPVPITRRSFEVIGDLFVQNETPFCL